MSNAVAPYLPKISTNDADHGLAQKSRDLDKSNTPLKLIRSKIQPDSMKTSYSALFLVATLLLSGAASASIANDETTTTRDVSREDIARVCWNAMHSDDAPDRLKARCRAWFADQIDRDDDGVDRADIARTCWRIHNADQAPAALEERCRQWLRNQIDRDDDGVDRADIMRTCARIHDSDQASDAMKERCRQWRHNQIDVDGDGVDRSDIIRLCRWAFNSDDAPARLQHRCATFAHNHGYNAGTPA